MKFENRNDWIFIAKYIFVMIIFSNSLEITLLQIFELFEFLTKVIFLLDETRDKFWYKNKNLIFQGNLLISISISVLKLDNLIWD